MYHGQVLHYAVGIQATAIHWIKFQQRAACMMNFWFMIYMSVSWQGTLAEAICCLMSFLHTTATSSSHFPLAVGIFQVSCFLRNWWTEYTRLASTSQQQPASGHHLPNHKVILYGNSILWPSRYCSSPNLLASWCAAMTAMTVQLAVIGKAARAQRREGPRVPYAS